MFICVTVENNVTLSSPNYGYELNCMIVPFLRLNVNILIDIVQYLGTLIAKANFC